MRRLVPGAGLEPARPFGQRILNPPPSANSATRAMLIDTGSELPILFTINRSYWNRHASLTVL